MNWASAAVAMTACGIAFAISPPSLWQQRSSSVEKKSDASVFGKSENSLLKVETSQYKVSTDDWKGPVIYGMWIIPPMKILKSTESMQSMERQEGWLRST